MRAAKGLCNHLELILQDNEIDPELRVKNLNIVKMTMYLLTQIMKVKDVKLAADVSSPTATVYGFFPKNHKNIQSFQCFYKK